MLKLEATLRSVGPIGLADKGVTVGNSSPASKCCAVRVYKYWAGVDDRFRVWRSPDFVVRWPGLLAFMKDCLPEEAV